MAEIRYYLKVTVGRKEFFKENPRVVSLSNGKVIRRNFCSVLIDQIQTFNFLPIEPPRVPPTTAEAYARRKHEFSANKSNPRFRKAMSSLKNRDSGDTPHISLDARLPNPPIITCNEKIPLRLLVKRLNNSSEPLYLSSLQIALIGYTHIRAYDAVRNETSTWVIMSRSNIASLLSPSTSLTSSSKVTKAAQTQPSPSDERRSSVLSSSSSSSFPWEKQGRKTDPVEPEEVAIDPTAWDVRIPNSVAPTFETCNITRKYDLEIQAGIGYGSNFVKNVSGSPRLHQKAHEFSIQGLQPTNCKQQIVLPLRLPIQIYSGIHPPPALLQAMNASPSDQPSVSKKPLSATAISNITAANAAKVNESTSPPTPSASFSSTTPSASTARPTRRPVHRPHAQDEYDGEEPPPSYEDAIADELGPIDGPRDYQPPPVPAGAGGFEASDEKGGRGRRDS